MKTLLKIEELGQFLLAMFLFSQLDLSWWWFFGLLFAPDIGMLGYLVNPKVGALAYTIFHHKALAIFLLLTGFYAGNLVLEMAGIILFAHASFDRIWGYGLKYEKGFKYTHLGEIGA
ncbi:DUF4260 domain-containing protein [Flavimarina sp. Hel_I_48]|uniref:DUF4260 domain-containing protein n=1 Tax=Flavimarina sp. Hel_I_48 TaxID=1392488 RepID=UPI0004DF358F|nr:DUF4260 domain-containing protein [Flavimarina sp. Hel_I_48]